MQSIIRIDEMEKPGVVKVSPSAAGSEGNVRHFPSPAFKRPVVEATSEPVSEQASEQASELAPEETDAVTDTSADD